MAEKNLVLKGVPVSPGIAIGSAFLLHRDELQVEEEQIAVEQVASEVEKFKRAIQKTKEELLGIRHRVALNLGEDQGRIFDVQLLMLDDAMTIDQTIAAIQERRRNAEFIFWENLKGAISIIESADKAFFRERAVDIRDLGRRVLHNLLSGLAPHT